MNVVEIFVDDEPLDLYENTDIKFTFQVNDIADVKDRQTNYTNSFNVPKTANNIRIFKGLGIHSDTSDIPYQKPNCKMKIQGFDLIVKGWLNISDTTNDYKCFVYSGVVNFFKAIENKTLGDSIFDIKTEHRKNTETVVNSFHGEVFKYLIADYNGNTHFDRNGQKHINIDYLVPSVSVKYLWERIHSKLGFTYSGKVFNSEDFTNLWLTYPKYIENDNFTAFKNVSSNKIENRIYGIWQRGRIPFFLYGLEENKKLLVAEDATYRITVKVNNRSRRDWYVKGTPLARIYMSLNQEEIPLNDRQGEELIAFQIYQGEAPSYTLTRVFNAGDEISFFCFVESPGIIDFDINVIIEKNNSIVDIANELKGFPVKDFVKEIINRFGLTIFTDEFSDNIQYLTLKDRLNIAKKINWTDKYISRTSEKYVNSFYAQNNNFKFQYNDKEANHNDGILVVRNENITESKDLFKSKIYSPEKVGNASFYTGSREARNIDIFKFYDKEIDEEEGVDYKGLENRFYLIKESRLNTNVNIGSVVLNESQSVSSIPVGTFDNADWTYYLKRYYYDFGKILNDFRLHNISLNLSFADVINIDFNALYYFEQEQQYYLLNRLNFDSSKATGEFIRVKQNKEEETIIIDPPAVDEPPVNPELEIQFEDGTTGTKLQTEDRATIVVSKEIYDPKNKPTIKYWQVYNGTDWVNITRYNDGNYLWQNLHIGEQSIRLRAVFKNEPEIYSNVLRVGRLRRPLPDNYRKRQYQYDIEQGVEFLIVNHFRELEWIRIPPLNNPQYGSDPFALIQFLAYDVIIERGVIQEFL